jgi:hypothetical protein
MAVTCVLIVMIIENLVESTIKFFKKPGGSG